MGFQDDAWQKVHPLVVRLRRYYDYALELETSLCLVLGVVCSPEMHALEHLEKQQVWNGDLWSGMGTDGGLEWGQLIRVGGQLAIGLLRTAPNCTPRYWDHLLHGNILHKFPDVGAREPTCCLLFLWPPAMTASGVDATRGALPYIGRHHVCGAYQPSVYRSGGPCVRFVLIEVVNF